MGDIDDNRGKEVTVPLSQSTMPGEGTHQCLQHRRKKAATLHRSPYLANDPVIDRVVSNVFCQTISSSDTGLAKHEEIVIAVGSHVASQSATEEQAKTDM